ncbi:peptidase U34 dipeptidase [Dethiosulfovibrio peptidovorans DSM 11002]|uniref:Dipeptidase n=1 Tax=Dethiosulfovibrio peptidovorans DSM 11002 TaxID=469381 RepID=D2Z6L7_9BACT|nr:C69 family dipeptidase [Dethiosulfovibrio peptidovorans]EFC91114.1 peptidase U34 dipeptidase [Dethiosulfovibrio peptidovorans DSM 11002]
MKKFTVSAVFVVFLLTLLTVSSATGCTTMLISKGATEDGSVVVSHSDDNDLMDQRIIYVPAMDHEEGAVRSIYCSGAAMGEFPEYRCFLYPRMVTDDRGPAYMGEEPSIALGTIPQVPHTYAYFDGNYGIMNEHQLMFGECTDGAKITAKPEPGKRIFYSSELSRVALERCRTAREAIALMGSLIEEYGYYGTGETLPVADTEEGWIMEIAPSPEGTGGLWVAKRVPDGEMFVGANEFRIREVDRDDPDMMVGKELFPVAKKHGWWKPSDGPLDWLRTVSLGEYNHPYYSLRRVWRAFSLAAPSLGLSPWVEDGYTKAYPFSIKPDEKLSVRDVMAIHRDRYEGTEFDLTKGVAAGPFGYPDRFYGPYDGKGDVGDPKRKLDGAWERPISVTYCGYAFVNQARGWLPDPIGGIMWLGLDKPADTVFMPFFVGVESLPDSVANCDTSLFSRDSAWWAFNFVSNWAGLRYDAIHGDIVSRRKALESGFLEKLKEIEKEAMEINRKNPEELADFLTSFCDENAGRTVDGWWDFSEELIVKYDDGFINVGQMGTQAGYPMEWLKTTSWPEGPTEYGKR